MPESLSRVTVSPQLESHWRHRLISPPPDPEPDLAFPPESLRRSAVLLPLMRAPEGYHVLLTVRASHLPVHAGQISFPGGRQDPADADLWATALRETHEEIGLPARHVELLAPLQPVVSITRFHVTPFAGFVPHDFDYRAHPDEVAEVLYVPLDHLRDPAVHHVDWHVGPDGVRHPVHHYAWGRHDIWGMTGRILHRFLTLISDAAGPGQDRR